MSAISPDVGCECLCINNVTTPKSKEEEKRTVDTVVEAIHTLLEEK